MSGELRPTEIPPIIPPGWREVLETIDLKQLDAHRRIRDDLERTTATLSALATRVESNYNYFVLQQGALQRGVDEAKLLAQRPVNGIALVWDTKTVVAVIIAIGVGVGMYLDLKQGNKDLRTELTSATEATTKAITEIKQQREVDKREAADRLNQFLNSSLEKAIIASGKGLGK